MKQSPITHPRAQPFPKSMGACEETDDAVTYARRARGERKRPSRGWASLTPTELEIVRLAAAGLTNPQIGERMFIARGTVKVHLSHIFAKLDISSRTQLAAEATRRIRRAVSARRYQTMNRRRRIVAVGG
jgi:DNA-binding CsgD family transcriptional regulator